MNRRIRQVAVAFVVVFAAAQLVRPERRNPATEATRTIQAHAGAAAGLAAILERSCADCHSNAPVRAWYARTAPLSWLMAYGVTKGRAAVNFSEWGSYSPGEQRRLLALSCDDAQSGRMPGAYARLRPETRLSVADVATLCAAARQAEPQVARTPN